MSSNSNSSVKIRSTSDGVYSLKRPNGDLVTFYHGLELDGSRRRVHVGDVVVLDCPEDDDTIKYPPCPSRKGKKDCWHPLTRPWKVGLIVALWGTLHQRTGAGRATEHFRLSVLWLHRDVHLHPNLPYKKEMQTKVHTSKRPFLLVESTDVQELPVSRIVPRCFVSLLKTEKDTKTIVAASQDNGDRILLQFCCRFRFKDPQLTATEKTVGWDALNPDHSAAASQLTSIPQVLHRLWSLSTFPYHADPQWRKEHAHVWIQEAPTRRHYYQTLLQEIRAEEEQEEEEVEKPPAKKAPPKKAPAKNNKASTKKPVKGKPQTAKTTQKHAIGTTLRKEFPPDGFFEGTVVQYDPASRQYKVKYEDGDQEEMTQGEIDQLLLVSNANKGKGKKTATAKPTVPKTKTSDKKLKAKSNKAAAKPQKHAIGTAIRHEFEGYDGWFDGTVVHYDAANGLYKVEYEEGHKEQWDEAEIDQWLVVPKSKGKATAAKKKTAPKAAKPTAKSTKTKPNDKTKSAASAKAKPATNKKAKTTAKAAVKTSKQQNAASTKAKKPPAGANNKKKRAPTTASTKTTASNKKARKDDIDAPDDSTMTSQVTPVGNAIQTARSNLNYFNAANVPLQVQRWDKSWRAKNQNVHYGDDETWRLQVGDIVAVALDQASPPPHLAKASSKSKQWYPYSVSWYPAMVMAIFEDPENDHQMTMLVRWFFRWGDLKASKEEPTKGVLQAQKRLETSRPETVQQLTTIEHMVLETNVQNDFPVENALGKLDMVSPTNSGNATTSRFSSSSLPPSLVLRCAHRFDALSTEAQFKKGPIEKFFKPAPEWGNYYNAIGKGGLKPWMAAVKESDGAITPVAKYRTFLKEQWAASSAVSVSSSGSAAAVATVSSPLSLQQMATSKTSSQLEWDLQQWKLPCGENGHRWLLESEGHDGEDADSPFDPLGQNRPLHKAKADTTSTHQAGPITSFWDSLKLPLLTCRFAKEAAKRADKELEGSRPPIFQVQVGDVVCVAGENETSKDDMNYPYRGPWKVGQVVTIYKRSIPTKTRKRKASKESSDKKQNIFVEIRWLPLVSELPLDWHHNLVVNGPLAGCPGKHKALQDGYVSQITLDVLESDMVERDVPATHILGPVDLIRQRQGETLVELSSRGTRRRQKSSIGPTIRCNVVDFWYWSAHYSVDPIYLPAKSAVTKSDEFAGEAFLERFFERCCKVSHSLRLSPVLAQKAPYKSKPIAQTNHGADLPKWDKMSVERGVDQASREFFQAVEVAPRWDFYQQSLCSTRDRPALSWTINVGDVVAVKANCDSNSDDIDTSHFPFTVPYSVVQVVAIYKDMTASEETSKSVHRLELRRFERQFTSGRSLNRAQAFEKLYETSELFTIDWHDGEAHPAMLGLLGAVVLHPESPHGENHNQEAKMTFWSEPHLPSVSFQYVGQVSDAQKTKTPFDLREIVQRGIRMASSYGIPTKRKLAVDGFEKRYRLQLRNWESGNMSRIYHDTLKGPAHTQASSSAELSCLQPAATKNSGPQTMQDARIHLIYEPIHSDKSSKRVYYNKISIQPGYENFAIRLQQEDRTQLWDVKLGDIIVVHYEYKQANSGPAYFEPNTLQNPVNPRETKSTYPFRIPWAVAEVLCIWKADNEDEASCASDTPQKGKGKVRSKCGVHLEVRWLYRKKELPGFEKEADKMVADLDTLEEIVESDHVDDIDAVSLLSPASLHSSPTRPFDSKFNIGMPVLDFFCRRFFSLARRSLLPCGSLDGRVARGKSHSKFIREDAVLRELIGTGTPRAAKKNRAALTHGPEPKGQQDAFLKVIKKLSLTDASKESSESVMIGREKEQKAILHFLKSAIRGGADEKGSSMFVAGPPGVGKTGCIRAAIAKLQRAQASGLVPAFRFVALNGMEMRHPFEAYVRLLEALPRKGGSRGRKSEEEAAAALERYFTVPICEKDNGKDKEEDVVTVVLLDEIDYLVTQKQTVMYNFFDWPGRSAALCNSGVRGRRLVVIGVSNTLNLPERLQPRVQSRIGDRRCYFKSYNVKEIQSILKAKIEQASPNIKVFDEDAIIFASRKTAAVCGDVRKAFQTCRSAAELVLNRHKNKGATKGTNQRPNSGELPLIKIPDVQRVSREASDSGEAKAVAHSTSFEALLMVSLASLSRSTGRESKGFDVEEILTKMEAIAGGLGDEQYTPAPRLEETLFLLNRLAEAKLVQLHTPTNASLSFCATPAGMGGAWPITSLLVAESNLFLSLRETRHNALAQKYLSKAAF